MHIAQKKYSVLFQKRKEILLSDAKNLEIKIESLVSKVSLYKNELASLEEKREEYEKNKHAIENLSSLIKTKQAVEIKMLEAKQRKEKCDKNKQKDTSSAKTKNTRLAYEHRRKANKARNTFAHRQNKSKQTQTSCERKE